MKRRRQQKLEKRMQEFMSSDGRPDSGTETPLELRSEKSGEVDRSNFPVNGCHEEPLVFFIGLILLFLMLLTCVDHIMSNSKFEDLKNFFNVAVYYTVISTKKEKSNFLLYGFSL